MIYVVCLIRKSGWEDRIVDIFRATTDKEKAEELAKSLYSTLEENNYEYRVEAVCEIE